MNLNDDALEKATEEIRKMIPYQYQPTGGIAIGPKMIAYEAIKTYLLHTEQKGES